MNHELNEKFKIIFFKLIPNKTLLKILLFLVGTTFSLTNLTLINKRFSNPIHAETLNIFSKKSFVTEALNRSGAAVVTLETQRRVFAQGNSALPPGLLIDPYLQRFFGLEGMNVPRSRIERGQGSGVIFSSEGLVLTNAHVVEKSEQLMIGMSDGRRVPGRVIGEDSFTDLAVIQLDGLGPWPTAPLGNSDKLQVGDWAIAVGNPFGLENTVTLGIISNLNRNISQLGISGKRFELIQTDAAINPGNSGGPLLNAEGEVIGINTLVRSGPGAGLGFAIPINRARQIAKQLIKNGRASHPMIGVSLSSIPRNVDSNFHRESSGAVIRYVVPGAPADIGGLQVGDIITSVGDLKVIGPDDVISKINEHGSNRPLEFIIKRGERNKKIFISPVDMYEIIKR